MLYFSLPKKICILLIVALGVIYSIPSFLSESNFVKLPSWLQKKVNFGLDLQGGAHLLLEVDINAAIYDQLVDLADDFTKVMRKHEIATGKISVSEKENPYITFKLNDLQQKQKVSKLLNSQGLMVDFNNDTQVFKLYFDDTQLRSRFKNLMQQTLEIINKRINSLGTKEPNIQTQGENRIIVQLPGVADPGLVKNILGKTAKLKFQIVHQQYPTLRDSGGRILPGTEAVPDKDNPKIVYLLRKRVLITGENLLEAQAGFHHENNAPIVHISFDNTGARKFGEITKRYTHHRLAMVLDGEVISAPTLNEPILSGKAQISGNFTVDETSRLSLLLRSGSLPAAINIIEERTVGPDLGLDSVIAGKKATIFAIIAIFIFMLVIYSLFGLFASIALSFNLLFLIAALALTGSVLTLPGIAGIALTLGMAVDANVLIFEHIKEEIRAGTKIILAIGTGYKRAMAVIMDSNITTLISGLALFFFGSGPIKGFGVTLNLGILISMFTAITFSRLIIVTWFNIFKPKSLPL